MGHLGYNTLDWSIDTTHGVGGITDSPKCHVWLVTIRNNGPILLLSIETSCLGRSCLGLVFGYLVACLVLVVRLGGMGG